MAHSIVKVTESQGNDSLLLVIGEDGAISPDKETVQSYLNNRPGATQLQVMHMNKTDGKNIDITLDTLTYIHSEEIIEAEEDMDELQRNLTSFRMDHDYTPLTSPKRQTPSPQLEPIDELAHTLSLLEGSAEEPAKIKPKQPIKTRKVLSLSINKQKAKMITTSQTTNKPKQIAVINKITKIKTQDEEEMEEEIESDDLFNEEEDDDENDSDFELEEKPKIIKKGVGTRTRRSSETPKMKKPIRKETKIEPESPKIEKEIDMKQSEMKQPDKKPPKKEKKVPKPPDDFALFSTPDIIRRVGGKDPQTPTTPTTPETPKSIKPAKISMENRSKSNDIKKRLSIDQKRVSLDEKTRRTSFDKPNKLERSPEKKGEGRVTVQGYDESLGSNSSESMMESQLEPLPSAEDIRSIIQNENTKSFTTSLIIPEPDLENNDQNQLESGLELDQSILDNINTDLISEDILYQVAQSLAENPDLQNVIDKSIVDGNLILDPTLQNLNEEQSLQSNQQTQSNNVQPATSSFGESSNTTVKGTQIIRPDGRVLVLPPIERPTTRSRNRRGADTPEVRQVTRPVKPLDDQHVSGNELDSSDDEEEESEDDPNKLWCICNQPHNNRFMICCDTCEEWYHGKCVNVTKAMGQMMEQEGKEWICVYCKDHSLKRPSAAARRVRKASRASRTSTDSASSQRKSTSALSSESLKSPACIVCRKSSRSNSIYCSDECILKHAQGVEKVVVFDRRTGKTLSGNAAPTAANLEKWLKEHPGFEVARPRPKKMMQSKLQFVKNSGNDGVSLSVNKKGVSIGVLEHSPKQEQGLKPKPITGIKILNKNAPSTPQKTVKLIQAVPITRPQSTTTNTTTTPTKPRILNPGVRQQTTPPPKEKVVVMKTPKARQAEVGQPKTENVRENVRKTLMEQLTNRLKMTDDLKLTPTEVINISNDIESQLYKCFGDTGQKYRTKYRSLIFNIKDVKNQTLWRRICEKAINPYQLVRLSHDDLASQELALWRQREAKHQLDMIEKSELELLNCNRQYVFKTHKGEQVFEDDRPKDQTVTEVITALNNEAEKDETKKDSSKEKDKKASKKRERSRDRKSSKEKSDSKERRKDHRSSSRDRDKDKDRSRDKERDRKKRSRSRDRSRHSDKHRSRSRDRDRHRKSSHKSSRHKKEPTAETKLDKKSKEILEQLVDKQIVPPLEDRLWKHVPQEDVVAGNPESDSDHEPSSTVTIPTPPRNSESDEPQSTPVITPTIEKTEKKRPVKSASVESIESISPKAESVDSRPSLETVWTGTINMVDVAQISITAHEVSGDCNGLNEELPSSLDIVGRITPETVWDYIGKMKCLHSKMISLLRLNATNMEEKMPYIALYSYLSSRNRLGVVKTINKAVKDFYILPLGSNDPIPQALLPINGAGFEDNRPPLLVGIIVRDKRKRPMLDSITSAVLNKKSKVDSTVTSPTVKARSATPPIPPTTTRSYTPPPSRDPRLKPVFNTPTSLPTPPATSTADEDEPYSPEDSDPEAITPPLPSTDSSDKTTTQAAATTTTLITTPVIKSNASFLSSQTFKPFSNKFDDIPGLDLQDSSALPASTQELQRKMAELDQRIAMQQAEIQNMSQDIVSSASATGSDIGTSALANIALPNNLQQILESIKIIGAQKTEVDSSTVKAVPIPQQDLTIPLMLPKISSRANQKLEVSSPTIPLNLPKIKVNKQSVTNSPQPTTETDKSSSSVLSSLSEEDLIRKAAEMLGETETPAKKQKRNELDIDIPPPPIYTPTPSLFSQPPPLIIPPPQPQSAPPLQTKRSRDMSQPPIPGLEDEC